MNEYQTTHNRQSSRGGAVDRQEGHIMDTDDLILEIAELWLTHADLEAWHYYQPRIAERIAEQVEAAEEERIRADMERAARAEFEREVAWGDRADREHRRKECWRNWRRNK